MCTRLSTRTSRFSGIGVLRARESQPPGLQACLRAGRLSDTLRNVRLTEGRDFRRTEPLQRRARAEGLSHKPRTASAWRRPASPSVGSRGDSYDNALAESIIGLFKTEVIQRKGPWRHLEAVEFATLTWVDWFNMRRLLEPIGYLPPAEHEARYYEQQRKPTTIGTDVTAGIPEAAPTNERSWGYRMRSNFHRSTLTAPSSASRGGARRHPRPTSMSHAQAAERLHDFLPSLKHKINSH